MKMDVERDGHRLTRVASDVGKKIFEYINAKRGKDRKQRLVYDDFMEKRLTSFVQRNVRDVHQTWFKAYLDTNLPSLLGMSTKSQSPLLFNYLLTYDSHDTFEQVIPTLYNHIINNESFYLEDMTSFSCISYLSNGVMIFGYILFSFPITVLSLSIDDRSKVGLAMRYTMASSSLKDSTVRDNTGRCVHLHNHISHDDNTIRLSSSASVHSDSYIVLTVSNRCDVYTLSISIYDRYDSSTVDSVHTSYRLSSYRDDMSIPLTHIDTHHRSCIGRKKYERGGSPDRGRNGRCSIRSDGWNMYEGSRKMKDRSDKRGDDCQKNKRGFLYRDSSKVSSIDSTASGLRKLGRGGRVDRQGMDSVMSRAPVLHSGSLQTSSLDKINLQIDPSFYHDVQVCEDSSVVYIPSSVTSRVSIYNTWSYIPVSYDGHTSHHKTNLELVFRSGKRLATDIYMISSVSPVLKSMIPAIVPSSSISSHPSLYLPDTIDYAAFVSIHPLLLTPEKIEVSHFTKCGNLLDVLKVCRVLDIPDIYSIIVFCEMVYMPQPVASLFSLLYKLPMKYKEIDITLGRRCAEEVCGLEKDRKSLDNIRSILKQMPWVHTQTFVNELLHLSRHEGDFCNRFASEVIEDYGIETAFHLDSPPQQLIVSHIDDHLMKGLDSTQSYYSTQPSSSFKFPSDHFLTKYMHHYYNESTDNKFQSAKKGNTKEKGRDAMHMKRSQYKKFKVSLSITSKSKLFISKSFDENTRLVVSHIPTPLHNTKKMHTIIWIVPSCRETSAYIVIEVHNKSYTGYIVGNRLCYGVEIPYINNDSHIDVYVSIRRMPIVRHIVSYISTNFKKLSLTSSHVLPKIKRWEMFSPAHCPLDEIPRLSDLLDHEVLTDHRNIELVNIFDNDYSVSTELYNIHTLDRHMTRLVMESEDLDVDSEIDLIEFIQITSRYSSTDRVPPANSSRSVKKKDERGMKTPERVRDVQIDESVYYLIPAVRLFASSPLYTRLPSDYIIEEISKYGSDLMSIDVHKGQSVLTKNRRKTVDRADSGATGIMDSIKHSMRYNTNMASVELSKTNRKMMTDRDVHVYNDLIKSEKNRMMDEKDIEMLNNKLKKIHHPSTYNNYRPHVHTDEFKDRQGSNEATGIFNFDLFGHGSKKGNEEYFGKSGAGSSTSKQHTYRYDNTVESHMDRLTRKAVKAIDECTLI